MSTALARRSAVEPARATHASIAAARSRLAQWLLHSPVQQATGENAGAVAGWIDSKGAADYVYPEITGYYLQWLASQALHDGVTSDLAERAAAAQRWLRRLCDRSATLPTRIYLGADRHDWRNDASFAFDLAMVLRGLAWAARAGLIAADQRVVVRVCAELLKLIAEDGVFRPFIATDERTCLPVRWSTRRGSFMAKAAAGVLFAADVLPHVPLELQGGARRTLRAAAKSFVDEPHAETHAFFYAIEGFLSYPDDEDSSRLLPRMATEFRELMADAQRQGHLPETRGAPGKQRLDIVAQAARVGWLLRSQWSECGPEPAFVSKMTRVLVRQIGATGALAFDPGAKELQFNAWSAMFAEQALELAERREGRAAHARGIQCIV